MREIKIRVYDRISKKVHEWDVVKTIPLLDFMNYEHYVISQFTGGYDFYGNEIYDGDVLTSIKKKRKEEYVVSYNKGHFNLKSNWSERKIAFGVSNKLMLKLPFYDRL